MQSQRKQTGIAQKEITEDITLNISDEMKTFHIGQVVSKGKHKNRTHSIPVTVC